MFYKILISLSLIVISFISFFYFIKYISYHDYIFKSSINGEQLIVLAGKDYVGEVIYINKREIRLKNEKIGYVIESKINGYYNLKFYLEDEIQFDAVGFSTKEMIFRADYKNISYNETINNDKLQFEKKEI